MKTPIILDENGNLLFFTSVEDVEKYVEPIDIINREYIAYDAEGNLLDFKVNEDNTVVLSPSVPTSKQVSQLKAALSSFYLQIGLDTRWVLEASLEDLINRGIQDYKTI